MVINTPSLPWNEEEAFPLLLTSCTKTHTDACWHKHGWQHTHILYGAIWGVSSPCDSTHDSFLHHLAGMINCPPRLKQLYKTTQHTNFLQEQKQIFINLACAIITSPFLSSLLSSPRACTHTLTDTNTHRWHGDRSITQSGSVSQFSCPTDNLNCYSNSRVLSFKIPSLFKSWFPISTQYP